MLKEQKLKKFKSRVDIGCNIFVQAEAESDIKNQIVMVALSKDYFVELSWDEALAYITKKESYLNKKSDLLTKKASEIKAHIIFVQEAIRELIGLAPEKLNQKQRQFM